MLKQIITCSYINSNPQLKHGEIQQIKIKKYKTKNKNKKKNHISKHASNLILNQEQQNINQSMFRHIH